MEIISVMITVTRTVHYPFKPSRCIKAAFYIPENRLNFPTTKGFKMKISMELVYQYMVIFFNFSPTSNHLHPLVVDEDDNDKFRLERVKYTIQKKIIVKNLPFILPSNKKKLSRNEQ